MITLLSTLPPLNLEFRSNSKLEMSSPICPEALIPLACTMGDDELL